MSEPLVPAEPVELVVALAESGLRLDAFLAKHFTDYSRVVLRRAITHGGVQVDERGGKPAYRLNPGQRVRIALPEIPRQSPRAEEIPLDILYVDDHVAVVNKPPGMVVHPARGHWSGTLASAVQWHFGSALSTAGGPTRPGIVHRLDRDTSGVILVARSDLAHHRLAVQFHDRTIEKEYFALVAGVPERDRDRIDCPIGVHPSQREKMAIRPHDEAARPALTIYEVLERFVGFAAVKVLPKTGRTHQIRVHLNHIGCAVLCDRQYGGRSRLMLADLLPHGGRGQTAADLVAAGSTAANNDAADAESAVLLERQALHARRLKFQHPVSGEPMEIEAPLPADIQTTLAALRRWRSPSRR